MSQCSWAGGNGGIKDVSLPFPVVLLIFSVCEENSDKKKEKKIIRHGDENVATFGNNTITQKPFK